MSEQEEVLYDVKDRIATVTLNRPDRMNSIDESMPGNIAKAMVKAANDPGVRCINSDRCRPAPFAPVPTSAACRSAAAACARHRPPTIPPSSLL